MNNEEKSRTLPRIRLSIFDVAVLLLLFFAVFAAFQKNNMVRVFERDRTQGVYAVAFEMPPVRYDLVNDLEAGTVIYVTDEDGMVRLGTMLDEPVIAPREGALTEGSSLVDLVGTLSCHGVLRGGSLVVSSDLVLSVGDELAVATEIGNMRIQVISITVIR